MTWLSIISFIVMGLVTIYCLLVLLALGGLFRLQRGQNEHLYDVSVVVAARNEQQSIGDCVRAFLSQEYPPRRCELVVVDDGSVDDTAKVVLRFAQNNHRVKLITPSGGCDRLRGKKRALEAGIRHSRGEIILITDADCRPVPTWIQTMVGYFEDGVGLVAGQVRQGGQRWWQKLRSLERLSMSAVAGGAIGWGIGLTAAGGNLGYRKEVFEEVGGFHDLARPLSGDDDLFIQLVSRRTRWGLRYAFEPEATVDTDPPANLAAFVAQERRRTSKGLYYLPWVKALAAQAFLLNLSLVIAVPVALAHPTARPLPLVALGMKALCELFLVVKADRLSGGSGLLSCFPLAAILHIPYFLLFSIWGTFGKYSWKPGGLDVNLPADSSRSHDGVGIC